MKLFFACLTTETNTFSNIPTTLKSFEEFCLCHGEDALSDSQPAAPLVHHLRERAHALGAEAFVSVCAMAQPGGPVVQSDYEQLRDRILADLKVRPVEAVILFLHGAMVSEDCDDCEGDLLARARAIVGAAVPICAVLDPHAHLSQRMVSNADVLCFMQEYPHTDGAERLDDAIELAMAIRSGRARPTAAVHDCRMIGLWPTQSQPMRGFVDRLRARIGRDGVLSISFVHGFPWGDTAYTGARMLVYTNGDAPRAASIARELGDELWSLRQATAMPAMGIGAALDIVSAADTGPIILADIADNPGGGAPSDASFILGATLERGLKNVAFGLFYDPLLVSHCHQVGVGGRVAARIGGKIGSCSGLPLDLEGVVLGLAQGARQTGLGGLPMPMGDTAWIRGRGVDVVLSSVRTQCLDPSAFTHIGLDPKRARAVVVKSTNHFHAAFAPIAKNMLFVASPGALNPDFASIPYKHLRSPYWPRVANPFAGAHRA